MKFFISYFILFLLFFYFSNCQTNITNITSTSTSTTILETNSIINNDTIFISVENSTFSTTTTVPVPVVSSTVTTQNSINLDPKPYLVQLLDDGITISVIFDQNTNYAGLSPFVTFSCLALVRNTASSIGQDASCFWVAENELRILLASTATITFGDEIVVEFVRAKTENQEILFGGSNLLVEPTNFPEPSVDFESPLFLGSNSESRCSSLTEVSISAANPTGLAGREPISVGGVTWRWNFSSPSIIPTDSPTITFSSTIFNTQTSLLVSLTLTNWLGRSNTVNTTIFSQSSFLPVVEILGPQILYTKNDRDLVLQGKIREYCNQINNNLVYTWALITDLEISTTVSLTTSGLEFTLPAGTLLPQKQYILELRATLSSDQTLYSYDRVTLNVVGDSAFVSILIPAEDRSVPRTSNIILDASSSYDTLSRNRDLLYFWNCSSQLDNAVCMDSPTLLYYFGDTLTGSNINSATLPANLFHTGDVIIFEVYVGYETDDYNTMGHSQVEVTIGLPNIPEVSLVTSLPPNYSTFNPSESLDIVANYNSLVGIISEGWDTIYTDIATVDGRILKFNSGDLNLLTTSKIKYQVTNAYGTGFASLALTSSNPLVGGTVQVSKDGISVTLEAAGFESKNIYSPMYWYSFKNEFGLVPLTATPNYAYKKTVLVPYSVDIFHSYIYNRDYNANRRQQTITPTIDAPTSTTYYSQALQLHDNTLQNAVTDLDWSLVSQTCFRIMQLLNLDENRTNFLTERQQLRESLFSILQEAPTFGITTSQYSSVQVAHFLRYLIYEPASDEIPITLQFGVLRYIANLVTFHIEKLSGFQQVQQLDSSSEDTVELLFGTVATISKINSQTSQIESNKRQLSNNLQVISSLAVEILQEISFAKYSTLSLGLGTQTINNIENIQLQVERVTANNLPSSFSIGSTTITYPDEILDLIVSQTTSDQIIQYTAIEFQNNSSPFAWSDTSNLLGDSVTSISFFILDTNTDNNTLASSPTLSLGNLTYPVQISLPILDSFFDAIQSTEGICQYWDEAEDSWSSEGCSLVSSVGSTVNCECSQFAAYYSLNDISGTVEPAVFVETPVDLGSDNFEPNWVIIIVLLIIAVIFIFVVKLAMLKAKNPIYDYDRVNEEEPLNAYDLKRKIRLAQMQPVEAKMRDLELADSEESFLLRSVEYKSIGDSEGGKLSASESKNLSSSDSQTNSDSRTSSSDFSEMGPMDEGDSYVSMANTSTESNDSTKRSKNSQSNTYSRSSGSYSRTSHSRSESRSPSNSRSSKSRTPSSQKDSASFSGSVSGSNSRTRSSGSRTNSYSRSRTVSGSITGSGSRTVSGSNSFSGSRS